ncbi:MULTISPECIES: homoserine O-succinyltransferase [unclassified Desulfovibrio]|uniref:homoserine O-acetyltransferase MetA n=1 Tax=unclassified Desulfovibrio TaxID=2593640 RepID=UPI000F5E34E3|nr:MULTISPECIES: homoserine O-succinyltransferase [unclassified Desulfovibrio]RRD71028.1 homoserine O-succinyltransferase [Desulfovibrio sp. OH1209_COT-279]RRD87370.1 homoserine O-succinyltransferase [Desulfovibrio sp. OH1186_COT-070]
MPIKIPADLPARTALESENIFVMTEDRAARQDIRPLEIAIVNLMPTKIATETQLLRLLGNTPLQINVTLLRTAAHVSKNTPALHLERFYKTFAEMRHCAFDGMIVTGAPVEHLPFEDVDYWHELLEIMTYAQEHVHSTLYICWAAQAALYHFYGIPKYPLPAKISGVFDHDVLHPGCHLFRGFDDTFTAPHSRHTGVRTEDVLNEPRLRVLAESREAGLTLAESRDHSQVFMTGHLEYDRGTLDAEFRRDQGKGLNPIPPRHYYPAENPDLAPRMNWRAHAHLFYSNWLNYYVYQETPFSLAAITGNRQQSSGVAIKE